MLGQTNNLLPCIVAILIGYLIGSLLPAYFIGRFRKVDIRTLGTKNPGTINVYKVFGLLPAAGTATFDCLKGVLAIFVAQSIGANFVCMQIAGLAAIVGHVFPFYLRFRGGQGVGSATGIMFYYLIEYISADIRFLYTLGFLLIVSLLFYHVTCSTKLISA